MLFGEHNNAIAITGPDGSGKETLVHEALFRYLESVEQTHRDYGTAVKIWHMDPTRIIAGMSVVGWWQKRLEAILKYVLQSKFPEECNR